MTSRINRSTFYGRAVKLRRCIKSLTLHDMINEVRIQEIVSRADTDKGGLVGHI